MEGEGRRAQRGQQMASWQKASTPHDGSQVPGLRKLFSTQQAPNFSANSNTGSAAPAVKSSCNGSPHPPFCTPSLHCPRWRQT